MALLGRAAYSGMAAAFRMREGWVVASRGAKAFHALEVAGIGDDGERLELVEWVGRRGR
jgi:hypothetical protein